MSGALVCRDTGARLPLDAPLWRSPRGGLLDIDWTSEFPRDAIARRPATMWRYREAIPIPAGVAPVTLGEGMTPLIEADLPARGGQRRVLVKLEGLSPSGSYKDRGAAVVVTHLRRLGLPGFVEDSSGNAGAAFATYAARAGVTCELFVPAGASPAKLMQMESLGATLHRVPGPRQAAADAALAAAQTRYYASHCWNPFFFHGTKTFAFEVCEQLGWRAPGAVVIPTGNGTLLIGAHIGFEELRRAGVIDRVPRLFAVQAAACAPLAAAWSGAAPAAPTIAEGIAIPAPPRADQCLDAVRLTGGGFISVSEDNLAHSLRAAVRAGLFIEPTSAAAVAALGHLDEPGEVVVALTGHGLKAAETVSRLADGKQSRC